MLFTASMSFTRSSMPRPTRCQQRKSAPRGRTDFLEARHGEVRDILKRNSTPCQLRGHMTQAQLHKFSRHASVETTDRQYLHRATMLFDCLAKVPSPEFMRIL